MFWCKQYGVLHMPELIEHEKQSLARYGKKFTELHQWMDEPTKIMHSKHRKYRHDPYTTPKEVKKLFGENADNACLDHIIMDFKPKNEGISGKSKIVSLRIPNDMLKLLGIYSKLTGDTMAKTIKEMIKEGLYLKANVGIYNMFQNEMLEKNSKIGLFHADKINKIIEYPSILIERDNGCVKCHEQDRLKLTIYHIDRNPSNCSLENIVIICDNCKRKLEKFIYAIAPTRKFIEWYSLGESSS